MSPIPPPALLGVLGGGQLGRFFALAAQRMGYRVAVLDPDPRAPAHQLADVSLQASFDDRAALQALCEQCAAVTIETENVPRESLALLARCCTVAPGPEALAVSQDRLFEKRFLSAILLPVAPFAPVLRVADLARASLYPAILKTARHGYDGKGQAAVDDAAAAAKAWRALGEVPCVLEKRMALERELSVVLARGADGAVAAYPVAENRHRDGILELTVAPARIDAALARRAVAATERIAEALDYVGVLAVEFFVCGGDLLVNEIAPRPHNSGHYTLDACRTSQFEQQVRALCRLPLGPATLDSPAAMANVLGDAWRHGEPPWPALLGGPEPRLHLYGKREPRPGRKMGHVTVIAAEPERAAQQAEGILSRLAADRGQSPNSDSVAR